MVCYDVTIKSPPAAQLTLATAIWTNKLCQNSQTSCRYTHIVLLNFHPTKAIMAGISCENNIITPKYDSIAILWYNSTLLQMLRCTLTTSSLSWSLYWWATTVNATKDSSDVIGSSTTDQVSTGSKIKQIMVNGSKAASDSKLYRVVESY